MLFRHHEFFVRNPLPISHTPTDREPTYWTFLVVVITCFYYPQFTNDIVKLFCFWRSCYENMPLLMDARQRINTIGEISFTEVQRSHSEKSMNYLIWLRIQLILNICTFKSVFYQCISKMRSKKAFNTLYSRGEQIVLLQEIMRAKPRTTCGKFRWVIIDEKY